MPGWSVTPAEIIVTFGTNAITFLASQSWGVGKAIYRERKLKSALQREIIESRPWLSRNLLTFECMIQLNCVGTVANHGAVPIPIDVHAAHFPEIVLHLSTEEKISINGIYNLLYLINVCTKTIGELNPQCMDDDAKRYQMAQTLDTAYRSAHHALLLINLHLDNIRNLKSLTESNAFDAMFHSLAEKNDKDLLALSAEARLVGEKAIRMKYHGGAVSASDVSPTPPPKPGRFYYDTTGAKYKCIDCENGIVTMMQLESQVGVITFDVLLRRPTSAYPHVYEITDADGRLPSLCIPGRGPTRGDHPRGDPRRSNPSCGAATAEAYASNRRQGLLQRSAAGSLAASRHRVDLPTSLESH
jgi:hypothetical protein